MYNEHHHNTIGYEGERKVKAERKAAAQDAVIYNYMNQRPGIGFTPIEIQAKVLPNCPVTSVRRSMSNLTNKGLIIKTNEKRIEMYGHDNHLWMYPLHYECKLCNRSIQLGKQCGCRNQKQVVVQIKLF